MLWAVIEAIFHDNQLSRAVYVDAEYHALVQGDLSIMQYCTRLKTFADQLRDLGQPVSETQQLFNMIRGLGCQYHGAIPHLTSRVPLPSFLQARSFLLLEEHRAKQTTRIQHAHAMVAGHITSSTPPSAPNAAPPADSSAGRGRGRGKRRGRGSPGASSSTTPPPIRPPALPGQAPSANSWTGLVQAWPMPWRMPGDGILGPRPGIPPQQAFFAGPAVPSNPPGYGAYGAPPGYGYGSPGASSSTAPPPAQPQPWDMGPLHTALQAASTSAPSAGSTSDWYLDSGATAHMTANPGTLHSLSPNSSPNQIVVGNGGRLPITHTGHGSLITTNSPLVLRNVLLSPSLITNLLSVRQLTRENPVSVEFDEFGFSVKDIRTCQVIRRCDSTGDLYPVTPCGAPSSSPPFAGVASVELWHQRLGHPGDDALRRVLHQFPFTCAPSAPPPATPAD